MAFRYKKVGLTHVVEVDPMDLRISVQNMRANLIPNKNFVTSGYQTMQAVGGAYPLGIFVSEGKVIQNRQPHLKPSGTIIVYSNGRVEGKPLLDIREEKDVWFAVSGCSIWPSIRMREEGFTGVFADIGRVCPRPVIGYRKEDNKIIIAVRNNSNIGRGQLTLKNLGCDFGITLDAGGSTVLRVSGIYMFRTTRQLHNVITW